MGNNIQDGKENQFREYVPDIRISMFQPDPNNQPKIGNRDHITEMDIVKFNKMNNCSGLFLCLF